jgi:hypothetical protein
MNWWLVLSIVGGVAIVLADQYRVQARKGEPWLGGRPRLLLAILIPGGMLVGWATFYYSPPILYRGVVAFIALYNDPGRPLLTVIPGWIGIVFSFCAMRLGASRWRKGIEEQKSGVARIHGLNLMLAVLIWIVALAGLIFGVSIGFSHR